MKKQGVVWVSTVLYILISLAVLAIVLVAVQPRIDAVRDKATIDQTVNMLNELDQKIIEVDNSAQGNVRSLNLQIKKGTLIVDENKIQWQFRSSYKYSEPNRHVKIGRIDSYTTKVPRGFNVLLTLDYEGNVILVSEFESLQPAETPYKIFIKNSGSMNGLNKIIIYST